MLYKRVLKWLGVLFSSVFVVSFLFSYNLSSRGFFDFEQYLEDLRAMGVEARERLTQNNSEANGEVDESSEDEESGSEEGDKEDGDKSQQSEDSEAGFTDEVYYEDLSEYRGQNPYTSFLSDRLIVRNMRYLIGPEYYKYFLKSIPNAEEVYYDEESKLYTVMGRNEILMDNLSGIVQLKSTGQMYIAYIRDGNIHYHTNDRDHSEELIQNRYMNQWFDQNGSNKDIIYFNRSR